MNFISDINHQGSFNAGIVGKIVRRTGTAIITVGKCDRYLSYINTYPYDFEAPSPDLSPNIILGKLTGYYTIDSYYAGGPYYKCELQLFNHIWSNKGNPIYFVDLFIRVADGFVSNVDFQLLTDTGAHTITGNVARSFFDRGGRRNYFLGVSYFPHLDPDYLLFSNPKQCDDYFNNTNWLANYVIGQSYNGISVSQQMIDSYQDYAYQMPRTNDSAIYPSDLSAKSFTIQFGGFWNGYYLKTKGVNVYSDAACTMLIGTVESGITNRTNLHDFDFLRFTGLTPNTLYYVRSYYTRYGNPLLGESETATFTYLSAAYPITTAIASSNPIVILGSPKYITNTSFTTSFSFSSEGDFTIKEAGVCYGTNPLPTVLNGKMPSSKRIAYDAEDVIVNGLTKNTLYYTRAYAIKSDDTVIYSEADRSFSFTTTNLITPTTPKMADVTLLSASYNAATVRSQVTDNGGSPVTAKGVCWNLSGNPTIAGSHQAEIDNRMEMELFFVAITGLTQGTKLYVRGYATNSTGTGYSDNSYTLNVPDMGIVVPTSPVIAMGSVTGISNTSATFNGVISDLAGKVITSGGFRYRTVGGAWVNALISGLSSAGTLLNSITGLVKETAYEVEVYLACGSDIYESAIISFRTIADPVNAPVISIDSTFTKASTTANVSGTITSLNGNSTPVEKGFCWDNIENPIVAKVTGKFVIGTTDSATNKFKAVITGLSPHATYHVKSYVQCGTIVTLSDSEIIFMTDPAPVIAPPAVTTSVKGVTSNYGIINAAIIANNGSLIWKGIAISLNALSDTAEPVNDAYGSYKLDTGSSANFGVGFDLIASTTYHARAFAQSEIGGIVWGNQIDFTTPSQDAILQVTTEVDVYAHSSVDVSLMVTGVSIMNGVVYSSTNKVPSHMDSIKNCDLDTNVNIKLYAVAVFYIRSFATDSAGRPVYGNVITVTVDSNSDNSLGLPRFPYIGMVWLLNGISYEWNGFGWAKKLTGTSDNSLNILNSKSFNI